MEENQMQKKRNYERYLEGQNMQDSQNGSDLQGVYYTAPEETANVWTQDSYETYETYESPRNSYNTEYPQPQPMQNYAGLEEPVSKGEWALCYFLMMIPCVGFIMMFVWAFSSTEKKSKSNFFKVQLIFVGVIFALYFLFFLFAMIMGIAMGA